MGGVKGGGTRSLVKPTMGGQPAKLKVEVSLSLLCWGAVRGPLLSCVGGGSVA